MTHTYRIRNLRCDGCASTIRRRLGEAGFTVLDIDPGRHAVTIAADAPERLAAGAAILASLGYPLADEDAGTGEVACSVVGRAIGRFGPT